MSKAEIKQRNREIDNLYKRMRNGEKYVKLVDSILNSIDVLKAFATTQYADEDSLHQQHTKDDWRTIESDIRSLKAESIDNYEYMSDERNRLTKEVERLRNASV